MYFIVGNVTNILVHRWLSDNRPTFNWSVLSGKVSRDFYHPFYLAKLTLWVPDWHPTVFSKYDFNFAEIFEPKVWLHGVSDTAEILPMRISLRIRDNRRIYFRIWITGPDGLETLKKGGVTNLVTLSLSPPCAGILMPCCCCPPSRPRPRSWRPYSTRASTSAWSRPSTWGYIF